MYTCMKVVVACRVHTTINNGVPSSWDTIYRGCSLVMTCSCPTVFEGELVGVVVNYLPRQTSLL